MTVGSQVKSCFASIKSAEATLEILLNKSQNVQTIDAYKQASNILQAVKKDLYNQIKYITREEPQY